MTLSFRAGGSNWTTWRFPNTRECHRWYSIFAQLNRIKKSEKLKNTILQSLHKVLNNYAVNVAVFLISRYSWMLPMILFICSTEPHANMKNKTLRLCKIILRCCYVCFRTSRKLHVNRLQRQYIKWKKSIIIFTNVGWPLMLLENHDGRLHRIGQFTSGVCYTTINREIIV